MDLTAVQDYSDKAIDADDAALRSINLNLHANPEVCFEEHYAHKILTDFLEERGFEVQRKAYGLDTAFKASYGPKTGRAVVVNLEYDALDAIGHACGHNLIATAGLSAVVGAAKAIEKYGINGRVIAMGTPAEEGGGGKIKLIRAGAYDDAFCCMMVHPMRKNNAYSTSMCGSELTIEYIGKPAHAMVAPWEGINALDAVTLLQTSIGLLRQQIHPTDRIRGVVLEAGKRSGIIPEYARARYCVRSASMERYKILKKKFVNCLEAAALATGCELRTTWLPAYWDIRTNEKLAERYVTHMERLGVKFTTPYEQKINGDCYSTDMGNVTYVVPSIHPTFALDCPDGDIHTREFATAAATDDSHQRALQQGKSMASTCLEVLLNDDFAALVKQEFDEAPMSLALDPEVA